MVACYQMTNWMTTEILSTVNLKQRAKVISHFISVCDVLPSPRPHPYYITFSFFSFLEISIDTKLCGSVCGGDSAVALHHRSLARDLEGMLLFLPVC